MYHWNFADNCIETPTPRCFGNGLGPTSFDCSGLVLAALCDATGKSLDDLQLTTRHVRDMWQSATYRASPFQCAESTPGNLLVTKRVYTLGGQEKAIAGHIGIITGVETVEDATELRFIHANPSAGRVEMGSLSIASPTILGSLAVNL